MKRRPILAGCILTILFLLSFAHGQWLERSFWLQDSFPALRGPELALVNQVTGRVYLSGPSESAVNVFDAATASKFGFLGDAYGPRVACHLYNQHRIVLCTDDRDGFVVYDDRADTVVARWAVPRDDWWSAAYCADRGKLYAMDVSGRVLALDGVTGTLLATIGLDPRESYRLVWDSLHDRVYAGGFWDDEPLAAIDCASDSQVGSLAGTEGSIDMLAHPTRPVLYCLAHRYPEDRLVLLVFDTEQGAVTDTVGLPLHFNTPEYGRLIMNAPRGRMYVASISQDLDRRDGGSDSVAMIDIAGDSLLGMFVLPPRFYTSAWCLTGSGERLYLSSWSHDSVAVVDAGDTVRTVVALGDYEIYSLAWDGNSNRVVAATEDSVWVLDAASDTVVAAVDYDGTPVGNMVWDIAGRLYITNSKGVGWIDDDGHPVEWSLGYGCEMVAYIPELRRIYLLDGITTEVYDCATDSIVASLPFPWTSPQQSLRVPGSRKLYVAYYDDSTCIYDIYSDSVLAFTGNLLGYHCYNPRTGLVYGWAYNRDSLVAFDPRTDSVVFHVPVPWPRDVAVNPVDNELWLLCSDPDRLLVYDCAAGTFVDTIALPETGLHLAWTPGHNKLYCVSRSQTNVYAVDCRSRALIATIHPQSKAGEKDYVFYNERNDKLYLTAFDSTRTPWTSVIHCGLDSVVAELPGGGQFAYDAVTNRLYVGYGRHVWVYRDDPYAVADQPGAPVLAQPLPTILRNVLNLQPAISNLQSAMVLLDASGRKAMSLSPGPNDISHLSPGVYFIHSPVANPHSLSAPKVVIQR